MHFGLHLHGRRFIVLYTNMYTCYKLTSHKSLTYVQTDATTLNIVELVRPFTRSLKFNLFQTLRNNSQQHATGCANERNMQHITYHDQCLQAVILS